MTADTTLFQVSMALAVLCGLSWLAIGGTMRLVHRSANRFFLANLCFGLSVFLLSQRTPQPSYLHYHGVEWLIFAGLAAFHAGILTVVNLPQPATRLRRALPIVLAMAITVPLPPNPSSFMVRALVFSCTVAWLSAICFIDCSRGLRGDPFPARARWIIGMPFLLVSLAMAVRAVMTALYPPVTGTGPFVPVPDFTPYLWALTILQVAMNISLAGLTAGRLVMRISALAERDHLTGCLNRRTWEQRLQIEFARSGRTGDSLACVFFDLDDFKRVNDEHGHDVGDQLLRHVVQLIQQQLRAVDALGRYGGEEFVLLLPGTQRDGARDVAERIRLSLLDAPLRVGQDEIMVAASFGVAVMGETETQASFLRRADDAMYEAKRLGRNRVEVAPDPGRTPPAH
jgi:diguanylate cyclase (GGDEF)-like protein